jgi:hypothetical protein
MAGDQFIVATVHQDVRMATVELIDTTGVRFWASVGSDFLSLFTEIE